MVIQSNNIAPNLQIKTNITPKDNNKQEDKVILGSTPTSEDFLKAPLRQMKSSFQLDSDTKQVIGGIGLLTVAGMAGYYAAQNFGLGGAAVVAGVIGVTGAIVGQKCFNSPVKGAGVAIAATALVAGISSGNGAITLQAGLLAGVVGGLLNCSGEEL